MEVMDGYKMTEVGMIPVSWSALKIEDLTTKIGDGLHGTPIYDESGNFHFANGNNLVNGKIKIFDSTKKVSKDEFDKHKRDLNSTSILLSINGTIGNVAYYNNEEIILGKSAAYLNVKKQHCKDLLFYLLQTKKTKEQFGNNLTGTTIKNLGLGVIRETIVPFPTSFKEQKAIATALNDMDTLLQSLDSIIVKKQAIKQGAMQQLLTPPSEGGKRLAGFSGKWEKKRLGDICQIFGRIGYRGYTVKDIVTKGNGAIALSPSNIKNGKINFSNCTYISWFKYEESPEIKIFNNDILLVKTGSTVGKTTIVQNLKEKATINPQLVVLKNIKINNYFLSCLMGFKIIQNQIKSSIVGGAIPTLSQELVSNFTFYLPPTSEEQTAIAKILSEMDNEIESLENQRAKYQQLKEGMMQELLTGKIRLV